MITPLNELISREKNIEATITLKKLLTSDDQEKANSETQTRLDAETSIDHQLVSKLIAKTTSEKHNRSVLILGSLKNCCMILPIQKMEGGAPQVAPPHLPKKLPKRTAKRKQEKESEEINQDLHPLHCAKTEKITAKKPPLKATVPSKTGQSSA